MTPDLEKILRQQIADNRERWIKAQHKLAAVEVALIELTGIDTDIQSNLDIVKQRLAAQVPE